MGVQGLDHINIDTCRLPETIAFYTEVLGLEHRAKPSGNTGAWLYLGDRAIVHINVVADDGETPATGRFNHVAFAAGNLDELSAALGEAGRAYSISERPDLGLTQIFTTDPNGISVELNVQS